MALLDALKRKAPGLHRFLTRRDRPWPVVREILAGALGLAVLASLLYGLTAQPLVGGYPVVVVTSGSMMHCANADSRGLGPGLGKDCDASSPGRLGTIDPGDLVFVRRVGDAGDVSPLAERRSFSYGKDGDVLVYRPQNNLAATPIIHRALFWLQVNPDGTFTVEALGIRDADRLDDDGLVALTGCDLGTQDRFHGGHLAPEDSGFITRGDNNPAADQCPASQLSGPVRLEWVLGKARGELPWIGLVKLFVDDFSCNNVNRACNFANAAGDSKVFLAGVLTLLIGGPWAVERGLRWSRRRREGIAGKPPEPPQPEPPQKPPESP